MTRGIEAVRSNIIHDRWHQKRRPGVGGGACSGFLIVLRRSLLRFRQQHFCSVVVIEFDFAEARRVQHVKKVSGVIGLQVRIQGIAAAVDAERGDPPLPARSQVAADFGAAVMDEGSTLFPLRTSRTSFPRVEEISE